jgi:hypothetical protein
MSRLDTLDDRQWLHAAAAVLVGLLFATGVGHRAGPVEVSHPLRPAGEFIRAAAGGLLEAAPHGVPAIQCVVWVTRGDTA